MRDNPYKDLPPLERRPDGSLYRMTPAQRKQAASLIRLECCCCEDGNCIVLDDGDTCTCPQTVSFSLCCKWFRWAVLPLDGTLEAETPIFSASSFCVIWFPLHKSEIRCPGVPGKAIDTHLLRILPLYRMIAKMQFPKCKLHQNAILAIFRELHFFSCRLRVVHRWTAH